VGFLDDSYRAAAWTALLSHSCGSHSFGVQKHGFGRSVFGRNCNQERNSPGTDARDHSENSQSPPRHYAEELPNEGMLHVFFAFRKNSKIFLERSSENFMLFTDFV